MKKNNEEKAFINKIKKTLGLGAAKSYESAMNGGYAFAKELDNDEKDIVFRNIGKAVCLADEGKEIMFNVITGNMTVSEGVQEEYEKCAKAANDAMQRSLGISLALARLIDNGHDLFDECSDSYDDSCKKSTRHTTRGVDGRFCKASKKCTGKCKKGKKNTKKSKFSWF